jgi:NitT/TauT family transport system substrate-binding protein
VEAFLSDYKLSVTAANEDIDTTATRCEELGVVAKAAIAKKALPYCNIVWQVGDTMKKNVSAYLQVLYDADPTAVGGALPEDGFYFGAQ